VRVRGFLAGATHAAKQSSGSEVEPNAFRVLLGKSILQSVAELRYTDAP